MTCTARLPTANPEPVTSASVSRRNTSLFAPANRGSAEPNRPPMSPSPAADSRASQIAWITTSPSLCPASPGSSGQ